jgi:hypothetical protein
VLILTGSNCRAETLINSLAGCGEYRTRSCLKAKTLNFILTREPVVLIEVGSDWIVEWLPMDGPHNLNWHCAPIAEKVQPF